MIAAVLRKRISPARQFEMLAIAALIISSGVHASLIREHLEEMPILGALFISSTVAGILIAGAGLISVKHWQPVATVFLVALIGAYIVTRLVGLDDWDVMGLGDKGFELFGLASLVIARRA